MKRSWLVNARRACTALASLALAHCAAAGDIAQLQAEIEAFMEDAGIPGAVMAVVEDGEAVWVDGIGKANLATGADATADTLFRVGSISKSFTALAVLKLVEEGQLSLDDPVRGFLPDVEYVNPWAATHPVTVAHLLEHTTGFDDIHFVEAAKDDDPDITLREGLAFHPHSRTSRWRPGTHMSYANSGPPMAALVLETVAARPFESYVADHVLGPIGMGDSTFLFPSDVQRMAKGHDRDGRTIDRYDHIAFRPSGSLNTTARDMAKYLRMMIGRGEIDGRRVFRRETIERVERPATTLAGKAGHAFGYGLGNYGSVVAGHVFHGHDGSTATGFMATSAYSADLRAGYFVALNTVSTPIRDIEKLIGAYLTADRRASSLLSSRWTRPPWSGYRATTSWWGRARRS